LKLPSSPCSNARPTSLFPCDSQKLDAETQHRDKANYPDIFKFYRETFGGAHYDFVQREASSDSPARRKEFYDQLYNTGGFSFWSANYKDLLTNQQANDYAYAYWRDATRARVNDPKVAELLAPTNPPHRVSVSPPRLGAL
jgi:hypothetical protein